MYSNSRYSSITLIIKLSVAFILFISLSACSSNKQKAEAKASVSAETLYAEAQKLMKDLQYEEAIKKYETLEAEYPLGDFAQQASIEQAYAYHKFDEPDTAITTIDRFMRVYPRSRRTDYALYLRGVINFTRGSGLIERIFPRDYSELDSVNQTEAFNDFATLIKRFPNSRYIADAQKRMHYLKNILGQSEVKIANYYMKRGAYLAAFNRADYAVKYHQGTPAVISALQVKNCAAKKLGKNDLANDTLRIIKLNFPSQASFNCS